MRKSILHVAVLATVGCVGAVLALPACGSDSGVSIGDLPDANLEAGEGSTSQGDGAASGLCTRPEEVACRLSCVDLRSDPQNCGSCGTACAASEVCDLSQCAAGCSTGLQSCGGACVDLESSPEHCGACGTPCSPTQDCSGGKCVCPANTASCGGACVDESNDPNNCGGCGTKCAAGQVCNSGACAGSCSAGLSACSGSCVDLLSENANCGACGTTCANGESCVAGKCACPAGELVCVPPARGRALPMTTAGGHSLVHDEGSALG
jgi:hypothetical protein